MSDETPKPLDPKKPVKIKLPEYMVFIQKIEKEQKRPLTPKVRELFIKQCQKFKGLSPDRVWEKFWGMKTRREAKK